MKDVIINAGTLKSLLESIDDVGGYLSRQAEDDDEACRLLIRLRNAKHAVEDQAKEYGDERPQAGG